MTNNERQMLSNTPYPPLKSKRDCFCAIPEKEGWRMGFNDFRHNVRETYISEKILKDNLENEYNIYGGKKAIVDFLKKNPDMVPTRGKKTLPNTKD